MRLENTVGGASKFWEAKVIGNQATIRFGKIGTDGQTQVKIYGSEAEAKSAIDKVAKKKLADGYVADGYDTARGEPNVASGVTAGAGETRTNAVAEVMISRLSLSERTKFAYYLQQVVDNLGAFRKKVEAHVNPEPGARMAFVKEIKPEVKADIAAKHDEVVALLGGKYAAFLKPTEANSPDLALLAEMNVWLKELSTWQGALKIGAFALGFDSPQGSLTNAVTSSLAALPRPPKAELTRLDAANFSKLGESDVFAIFADPEKFGYRLEAMDDAIGKKFITKLIGAERVKELLAEVKAAAEQDVEYAPRGRAGKPTLTDLEVLKHGDETVAYKLTAHCNAQPSDNDLLVDWTLDAKGKLLTSDTR
ncbi:MAG: WGR domain-containing protein [Deltaproteobacteria bacterium]|nr:WGR domain-containing protein [Deltaproteobacteria bacterium]